MVGEREAFDFFFFDALGGGGVPEIFPTQPWAIWRQAVRRSPANRKSWSC